MNSIKTCSAFSSRERIATGRLLEVAIEVKTLLETHPSLQVLFFDDMSGEEFDLDLRGSHSDIEQRLSIQFPEPEMPSADKKASAGSVGRPRLNVVSKEVTLQPRHWAWLKQQPGSASSVLRRLVDEARHNNQEKEQHYFAQKAVYSFISAIAGDYPGYEEAIRSLFNSDYRRFEDIIGNWPGDICNYAKNFYADLSIDSDQ